MNTEQFIASIGESEKCLKHMPGFVSERKIVKLHNLLGRIIMESSEPAAYRTTILGNMLSAPPSDLDPIF